AGAASVLASRRAAAQEANKPTEEMIKELYSTLSGDQKKQICLPYDHGADKGVPTRMGMYNAPIENKRIADNYTKAQQELLQKILRSISSGEEGFRQFTRDGTYDNSKSFDACGVIIF